MTVIGDYSFSGCVSLTNLIIGNSVKGIGTSAFGSGFNLINVFCYTEQAPIAYSSFNNSNYTNATLHVPAASVEAYKNAEQWKDFGNIVALTDDDPKPTAIMETTATQQPAIVERYTIDGKRITTQRGLNIIKMSDGTTRKVVVK